MLDWIKGKEPVIVAAVVAWIITNAGALVLGHTTWVTSDQWNTLATTLTPVLSAAVAYVLALLVRRVVVPVAKVIPVPESKPAANVTSSDPGQHEAS